MGRRPARRGTRVGGGGSIGSIGDVVDTNGRALTWFDGIRSHSLSLDSGLCPTSTEIYCNLPKYNSKRHYSSSSIDLSEKTSHFSEPTLRRLASIDMTLWTPDAGQIFVPH